MLGKEDVKLSDEMLSEIMSLLEKEESLEFAERIEKVVEREEQHKKATEAKLGSLGASEDKVK